jgi:molybdenum cofactor biosynthesis enzyme MoaA
MTAEVLNNRLKRANLRIALSPFCNLNCLYCDGPKSRMANKPGAMEDFRRKPLEAGNISTEILIQIIEVLHKAGFEGVSFTGGEPLLNKDWDTIVTETAQIGMSRVEITTNGMLLDTYLQQKGRMPEGLTLLKVSLDTYDSHRFENLTGGGKLEKIIGGITTLKGIQPELRVRANKVLLRSDLSSLIDYLDFCAQNRIDEVMLLDLVLNNPNDPNERIFFQREFVPVEETMSILSNQFSINSFDHNRYGYEVRLPSGIRVLLKDSNLTLRAEKCFGCPIYCQEGIYTIRVATDGTITTCPDRTGKLSFIDGVEALKNGTLLDEINQLATLFITASQMETLEFFLKKYGIKL